METNPGKVLQLYGIEVSPDDARMSADILQDYLDKGVISGLSNVKICLEAIYAVKKARERSDTGREEPTIQK